MAVAKAAKAELLEPFADLSLITEFIRGSCPACKTEEVYLMRFIDVIPFIVKSRREAEYSERYQEMWKFMNTETQAK